MASVNPEIPQNNDITEEQQVNFTNDLEVKSEQQLGKAFRLIKKIDSGTFGDVYLGRNLETNREIAVKVESSNSKTPMLFYEAKMYSYLIREKQLSLAEKLWKQRQPKIERGFPEVYYCSNEGDHNIMIMEHLGPNLEDLFQICEKKFSPKTVCMIAIQILTRLEFLHSRYIVHRDIKPSNFCIGKGKKKDMIYMIDLAFCKKYLQKEGSHIPMVEGKSLTGTMLFCSMNNHRGYEHSRRDDLESLAYMLLYFLKGSLPWQNIKYSSKKEKVEKTIEKKIQNPDIQLFKGIKQQEFKNLLIYAQNLSFTEQPDYNLLKTSFIELMKASNWENDNIYEWNTIAQSPESQLDQGNKKQQSQKTE